MEPSEALGTAAQIAVTLAGFAGQATWHNAETHTVENVGKTEEHALDIELKK
jgi:hypothetical protein